MDMHTFTCEGTHTSNLKYLFTIRFTSSRYTKQLHKGSTLTRQKTTAHQSVVEDMSANTYDRNDIMYKMPLNLASKNYICTFQEIIGGL